MLNEFIPLVDIDDPNINEIITNHFCNMSELTFNNFIPITMQLFIAWLSSTAAWKCFEKHMDDTRGLGGIRRMPIRVKNINMFCHIVGDYIYDFTHITFKPHARYLEIDLKCPPTHFINMFINEDTISLGRYFISLLDSIQLSDNFKVSDLKNDITYFMPGNVKLIKTFMIENDEQRTSKDICDIEKIALENIKQCFIEYPTYVIYTENVKVNNSYIIKSNSQDTLTCNIECVYKITTIEEWL